MSKLIVGVGEKDDGIKQIKVIKNLKQLNICDLRFFDKTKSCTFINMLIISNLYISLFSSRIRFFLLFLIFLIILPFVKEKEIFNQAKQFLHQ